MCPFRKKDFKVEQRGGALSVMAANFCQPVLNLYNKMMSSPDLTRFGKRCCTSCCLRDVSHYEGRGAKHRTKAFNRNSKFLIRRGVRQKIRTPSSGCIVKLFSNFATAGVTCISVGATNTPETSMSPCQPSRLKTWNFYVPLP